MEDYHRYEDYISAQHTIPKTDPVALYTDEGIYGRVVDAEDVESWTNLHAFTAKLFGLGLIHWKYIGTLIFHDALEQTSTGQYQEAIIQAMAQWVRHAGEAMSLILRRQEAAAKFKGADTTGKLCLGSASFCAGRWLF
ncbi:hypothetical protein PENSUB_6658 [Penicillium subrubescens]|uniref:Uncharacterized protein n=2 Tax=Penicillium subrubescens TaxID=1316194 RepID=A0A1Q5U0F1_9EURO|nr:hypothetical protein PENSUB_6658 [Penicillium subrubescens]